MQKKYNITLSINRAHLLFACVTLYSLLKNNQDSYFDVYILHNNCLTNQEIDEISNKFPLNQYKNFKIHLVDVSSIYTLQNKGNISSGLGYSWIKETLFKLFLSVLLPNVDTILHLDTDVMIRYDISKLFEIKEGYLFKGAKSRNDPWANAGVMLHNLKLARELNIHDKIVSFLDRNNVTEEAVLYNLFHDKVDFYDYEIALNLPLNKQINNFKNTISVHFLYPKPFALNRSFKSKILYNEYMNYLKDFIKQNNKWKFYILVFIFNNVASIHYSIKRRYKRWKSRFLKQKYLLDKLDNNFYMTRKILEYSIVKKD